jgi:hypothetical protein
MGGLPKIAKKVAPIIRMLASNQDGDVLNAARALDRVLKSAGADFHALADHVARQDDSRLSEAEMRKLYDVGYRDGKRAAENAQPTAAWHDVGTPLHKLALFCQQRSDRLRQNEREFIDDMTSLTVWHALSERQEKWLRSIYHKLGGRA